MSEVLIRNRANGGVVQADPALAGQLVRRGGWEEVGVAEPVPEPEPEIEDPDEDDADE